MNHERAEMIAILALGFIGGDAGRWEAFSRQTGIKADDVRTMAGEPEFLAALLAWLLKDDSLVQVFCGHHALEPTLPARAQAVLSGHPGPASI